MDCRVDRIAAGACEAPVLDMLNDDCVSRIISFLSAADIAACSVSSEKMRRLCADDSKVWREVCERRWGGHTSLASWRTGCVSFRAIHDALSEWENLIGYWRGVGTADAPFLIVFEWRSRCIMAFRLLPSQPGSLQVCKVPFLRLGLTCEGRAVCFVLPGLSSAGVAIDEDARCTSVSSPPRETMPLWDWGVLDFDLPLPANLAEVNLSFVAKHHVVVDYDGQRQPCGVRYSAKAAALASFGAMDTYDLSRPAGSVEGASQAGSQSSRFHHEMCEFLSRKVAGSGGASALRKQRRKFKAEFVNHGRKLGDPQHFVKVMGCCPTASRPFQGLWKGIGRSQELVFILLSYNDDDEVTCRGIGASSDFDRWERVFWKTNPVDESTLLIAGSGSCGASSSSEQSAGRAFHDGNAHAMDDGHAALHQTGRVWRYARDGIGVSLLNSEHAINFRLVCRDDRGLESD